MTASSQRYDRDTRLRLAQAVATDDKARYLEPDNTAAGYDHLSDAVASGRPFFVTAADTVLALDADRPNQQQTIDEIGTLLRVHDICPVVVASGQPGRRHLFARVEDAGLRASLAERASSSRIDVRRDIRPPLTPHRNGLPVALISPTSPQEAVDALQPTTGLPPLSRNVQNTLLTGGEYDSNSEMVAAIALGAVNAGWDYPHFAAAVTDPATYAGAYIASKHMTRRDPNAERWLTLTWNNAVTYAEANPVVRQDDQHLIGAIEQQIRTTPWRGQTGATDQNTLLGLLNKAKTAGRLTGVNCSERELAEIAGFGSRVTVRRSLTRLQEAGLIAKRHPAGQRSSRSATWDITVQIDPHLSHPIPETHGPAIDLGLDLFRYGQGLGKNALRIWQSLDNTPKAANQVAQTLGLVNSTVRKHLRRLHNLGLLTEREDGLWATVASPDFEAVAQQLGVAGRGERQIDQHRRERLAHQYMLQVTSQDINWAETPPPSTEQPAGEKDSPDESGQT